MQIVRGGSQNQKFLQPKMTSVSSASSWIESLSCSSSSLMAEDSSVLQWLKFIFLSPCPQRVLLSSIDILFLLIIFVFAIQKLYSRFTSDNNGGSATSSAIDEPLIAKNRALIKPTLRFKLSLLVTAIIAVLSIVSSVLAFTQNTQTPLKFINGISWLIQAISFITITILIIHERRFQAVKHSISLRVFWAVNFIIISILASSSITRLVSATKKTPFLKSQDIITSIFLPFSFFLLIQSINGSSGIIIKPKESESLKGLEADKLSNTSTWESGSILSKAFWLWMNPLLKKGYKTPLKLDEIPDLAYEHKAQKLSNLFEENWPKPEENSKHPVLKTLIRCFWTQIALTAFLAIVRLCVTYVGPLLIQRFVNFTSGKRNSEFEGYFLVLILLFAKFVEVLASHHFNFHSQKLGMMIRSTLITSLYKKGLKLSCTIWL